MSLSSGADFIAQFAALTPPQQQNVLAYMQGLKSNPDSREERRAALLAIANEFTREDIAAFQAAEAECELIDPHGW